MPYKIANSIDPPMESIKSFMYTTPPFQSVSHKRILTHKKPPMLFYNSLMMRPDAFRNSQQKKNLMLSMTVLYCFVKHYRHPTSQRVTNAIGKLLQPRAQQQEQVTREYDNGKCTRLYPYHTALQQKHVVVALQAQPRLLRPHQ